MKAVFIACDQALYDEVQQTMASLGVRGYTSWGSGMEAKTAIIMAIKWVRALPGSRIVICIKVLLKQEKSN